MRGRFSLWLHEVGSFCRCDDNIVRQLSHTLFSRMPQNARAILRLEQSPQTTCAHIKNLVLIDYLHVSNNSNWMLMFLCRNMTS
jgi:hypothetical protein